MSRPAFLVLSDGTIFEGESFGANGEAAGEAVFNTSMTGYQEIVTDPSYCGQIVTMTYPHIGNTGVNAEDVECGGPQVRGLVVREYCESPSNWRATQPLHEYLKLHNIVAITGVDTRALTRRLRGIGVMSGIISAVANDPAALVERARNLPTMAGQNLVDKVTCKKEYEWREPLPPLYTSGGDRHCLMPNPRGLGGACPQGMNLDALRQFGAPENGPPPPHILVYDFGVKQSILRSLVASGARVTVVPASTSAEDALARGPDGILLSNGPGDPAAVGYAIDTIRKLIGRVPLFGICLGHQLMGLALGAKTFKLKFGHRGANQPVKDLRSGKVTITSQNHGFAVDPDSLPSHIEPTGINLNDRTLESFVSKRDPAMACQYHPEASPGPHDAADWFGRFLEICRSGQI